MTMKNALILLFAAWTGLAASRTGWADQRIPPNLDLLKDEIRAFFIDGVYEEICGEITAQAARAIEEWQGEGKPALVLDVDETSLSTLDLMLARDFGYVTSEWKKWVSRARAPAIPSTLELARLASDKGFTLFFISGRLDNLRKATETNLRRAGYPEWAELILKPHGDMRPSGVFKAAEREKIEEQGYVIVVNLGDQESDVAGGHAEHHFKLPNPCYFVP